MSSKTFVQTLVSLVVAFFIANVILYFGFVNTDGPGADATVAFRGSDKTHGDLAGLANKRWPDSLLAQKNYANKHLEFPEYLARTKAGEKIKIDVLTLGDSFSNGQGGVYYQDYMADKYGLTVLNIKPIGSVEALMMVQGLISSGYMQKLNPKVVIVESVERTLFRRYDAAELPKTASIDEAALIGAYKRMEEDKAEHTSLLPGIMVKSNLNYLKARYNKLTKGDGDVVRWATLSKDLFTAVGCENELMYIGEDMIDLTRSINIEQTEKNIGTVADLCRTQGIEFVFLPCPDKSTIYYPYVVQDGREYPEKTMLDELQAQPRNYYMVDTKGILRAAAARGEQDLYWADDTHWSWRGFELVVDAMMQHMLR